MAAADTGTLERVRRQLRVATATCTFDRKGELCTGHALRRARARRRAASLVTLAADRCVGVRVVGVAAWPGKNGKIFFVTFDGSHGADSINSINVDGSDLHEVYSMGRSTPGHQLSADGAHVVFQTLCNAGCALGVD